MGGVDRLVAVGEIGARDQVEQVVGARAADDAVGVEPEGAADRLAQRGRGAVGVVLQVLGDGAGRPRSPSGWGRAASRSRTA